VRRRRRGRRASIFPVVAVVVDAARRRATDLLSTSTILSAGGTDPNGERVRAAAADVREILFTASPSSSGEQGGVGRDPRLRKVSYEWRRELMGPFLDGAGGLPRPSASASARGGSSSSRAGSISDALDASRAARTGGVGSLSVLDPAAYGDARRSVVSALLHHCSREGLSSEDAVLDACWRAALGIVEAGVRRALSECKGRGRRDVCRECCAHITKVSEMLLRLHPTCATPDTKTTCKQIILDAEKIYVAMGSSGDLRRVEDAMDARTRAGVLRCVGLGAVRHALSCGIRTPAAVEALVLPLPRLLGPGPSIGAGAGPNVASGAANGEIGSHYLSRLSGCACAVQMKIQSIVRDVLKMSGNILLTSNRHDDESRDWCSADSLHLTVLSAFFVTLRPSDFEPILSDGGLVRGLVELLKRSRERALPPLPKDDKPEFGSAASSSGTPEARADSLAEKMIESSDRLASAQVLRVGAALTHILVAQITHWTVDGPGSTESPSVVDAIVVQSLLDLLHSELSASVADLSARVTSERTRWSAQMADADWDRFHRGSSDSKKSRSSSEKGGSGRDSVSSKGRGSTPTSSSPAVGPGVRYLLEHGAAPSLALSRPSGSASAGGVSADVTSITPSGSPLQYLRQLLNIMYSAVRSKVFVESIALDTDWMSALLQWAGASSSASSSAACEGVKYTSGLALPAPVRVRILRLLGHILPHAVADRGAVQGLCLLGGRGFSVDGGLNGRLGVRGEGGFILTREAVSLMRRLFLRSDSWKRVIAEEMSSSKRNASSEVKEEVSLMERGRLAYLSGIPGRIAPGSYVLLKPAAAAALSDSASSASSSSKSHSSSSGAGGGSAGAGPVAVGTGAEGIVAGLCRSEAMAGMVSSIDTAAGTCEVVLFDRSSGHQTKSSMSHATGGTGMTVRALRANLGDVVSAEEWPLVLEDMNLSSYIGEVLLCAIQELHQSVDAARAEKINQDVADDEAVYEDDVNDASNFKAMGGTELKTDAVLALRSGIALLSSQRSLEDYLNSSTCNLCLPKILDLASTPLSKISSALGALAPVSGAGTNEGLSALPEAESKFWHLRSALHHVLERRAALERTPVERWETSQEELHSEGNNAVNSPDAKDQESQKEAFSTPPVTASSGGGILTTSDSQEGADEDGEGSHQGQRQTSAGGASASTSGTNRTEEDEDESSGAVDEATRQAEETAAAHLREAAIVQMAELGLPRSWSEYALRRVGGTNIEAAVHFCLERGGEMERLLADERERERRMMSSGSGGSRRRGGSASSGSGVGSANHLIRQLIEMGFPSHWCTEALAATGNNVDEALTWILTNGERLSAQDQDAEEDMDDEDDDEEEEDEEESVDEEEEAEAHAVEARASVSDDEGGSESAMAAVVTSTDDGANDEVKEGSAQAKDALVAADSPSWPSSFLCPLRFVSGRSSIDPSTLTVSGLPTGGFSSVGTKGVPLLSGKWYYEAHLVTAGCLQIGWADASFAGHCQADRGDGCGDGPSSWAYDGWRRYRWHGTATEWGCRWEEGDVVGCLVDLDEKVVSFTLNGRGEDIGMGVAFEGSGFRPCGGVYACVSFNRREKIRMVVGGEGSENFKYSPPPGYRGVGEAIHDAVKERELLLQEEDDLVGVTSEISTECMPKRYLCDFSDGEHGHELFAWQHRYYGSDASVHLGSSSRSGAGGNRPGNKRNRRGAHKSSGSEKSSGSVAPADSASAIGIMVMNRLVNAWNELKKGGSKSESKSDALLASASKSDVQSVLSDMLRGYKTVEEELKSELECVCLSLGILYARKLVLHVVLTKSSEFRLADFVRNKDEYESARNLWAVLEACASLAPAGWVGEAGAMAIAAEALGLGISSHDHHGGSGSSGGSGVQPGVAEYEYGGEAVALATGGISQVLSSVLLPSSSVNGTRNASMGVAACAEAALGGEAGGAPSFLRSGLQAAAASSKSLQNVLLAAVRRSVRLLAVVEYGKDDSTGSSSSSDEREGEGSLDADAEASSGEVDSSVEKSEEAQYLGMVAAPDARLALFLSGLLLSPPVQSSGPCDDKLAFQLFEAWSVGLLSASAPWRMVCAMTAASILNLHPKALSYTTGRIPTLERLFSRMGSAVSRRVWAERAAVPVCSRYVQAYIDLLSAVRRAQGVSASSLLKGTTVDAATPLPMALPTYSSDSKISDEGGDGHVSYSQPSPSWEWCEGWVTSDAGWEVWTGSVELMAVDWLVPSRSAVRTLMDGGEGPPMLREGCTVMRGLDWDDAKSGSEAGNEDGKDTYEKEKAAREKERQKSDVSEDPPKSPEVGPEDADTKDEPRTQEVDGESDAASDKSSKKDSGDKYQKKQEDDPACSSKKKKKKKKLPNPKLPIGTVLSVEPWNGLPGLGRRVRWHLTGKEGVYRYGGDGGRYDVVHVEVNEKATRVRKRHPLPESAEQCAARYGFGVSRRYSVILRLKRHVEKSCAEGREEEFEHEGVLEWPDFGAGVLVNCQFHSDGAVTITERELLFGSKDSGWQARFGQPSYIAGTVMVLSPITGSPTSSGGIVFDDKSSAFSHYEELLGSSSHSPTLLRNRADGEKLRLTSEMRLLRGKRQSISRSTTSLEDAGKLRSKDLSPPLSPPTAPLPPPICFDSKYHASSISLSRDGRTATCVTSDGRGTAFASVGFTKGVHYWEAKIEQADIGSVFIGVAEKPSAASSAGGSSSFGYDSQPRLNRWHGWGFVNFRATYTAGAERVYGAHCHAGDTVGVLLDCDTGRISFFFDGVKYGEHIVNDLGCAFENVSPFGFNADGCGSGGAGQGAPSGVEGGRGGRYPANGSVQPKALWPVVGLRNPGDRVTMSGKWVTGLGVDGVSVLRNVLATDEILSMYDFCNGKVEEGNYAMKTSSQEDSLDNKRENIPKWFVREAFEEYERWRSGRWLRSVSRGSGPHPLASFGLDVDIDTSPLACASACASLGLDYALLSGDRVAVKRSAGRLLELSEEAVVLGACRGRLFYRIVLQKSEGGSLTEGGGRAWFWDESEVVDNSLQLIGSGGGLGIKLPILDRFKCSALGGLKIIYAGGAVVRSDLEIFDGSANIGTIPHGTVVARDDVLERRVNSCGVVRYRIRYDGVGEGWISSRIRGGKEEAIVEPVMTQEAIPKETASHESMSNDETRSTEVSRPSFASADDAAHHWFLVFSKAQQEQSKQKQQLVSAADYDGEDSEWSISGPAEFEELLASARIEGMGIVDSDSLLASAVGAIADFSPDGDAIECPFADIASAVSFAVKSHDKHHQDDAGMIIPEGAPGANQAAAAVFASLNVQIPPAKALLVRIAMLRALNRRARFALPWLSVRPPQEDSAVLGGLSGFGASMGRAGRGKYAGGMDQWVQAQSIATRLRSCRRIIFTSVKKFFLEAMVDCTATPTPLSHDEYELPREVRTVRVNRLKARRAMASDDSALKRKHSVFSQLQHEMRSWSGAALRRGHVAKGHGGQKRAFKVKLVGEGVNDYSGPYREVFTDAMKEVTEVDKDGHGSLGVLEPSPNNIASIGTDRSLFVFSSGDHAEKSEHTTARTALLTKDELLIQSWFSSFTRERQESVREAEDSVFFLGRLAGTACRHGIPVDLPLPLRMVWNRIAESEIDVVRTLGEMDILACRQYEEESVARKGLSHPLVDRQQMMLNSFSDGLAGVLPIEIFSLMTGPELQDIMCGNPDIDVDLLRRVVEYEGYDENDDVITNFWEVLREMTSRDRKLFLQFVWARSRLPVRLSDFDTTFTIQRDTKCAGGEEDSALPSASTCFFSLTLPEYQSKDLLKKKLLFAIENVTTMESDYVTNDAEVGEGWRGL